MVNTFDSPIGLDRYGSYRIMNMIEMFPNKGQIHVRYLLKFPGGDRGWLGITCFDWR